MRTAIVLSTLIFGVAGGVSAMAQTQSVPANQRYCLLESGTGAMDCGFATLEQCRQTSNAGREGTCTLNPALTTGSGSSSDEKK